MSLAMLSDRPRSRPAARLRTAVAGLALLGLLAAPVAPAYAQDGPTRIVVDTEIDQILHADTDPIFVAAGLNPKDVKLHLVDDPTLNAFTPGGQHIFVNTGLIIKTKNPNELIGVVAHETGHVAGGHVARSGDMQRSAMGVFALTMGLGLLASLAGAPDAGAALMYNSGYFATLNYLGYSRAQEAAADQAALTYLETAHISGRGLVDFFQNMVNGEAWMSIAKSKFYIDHPTSRDRINALETRARQLHYYSQTDSAEAMAQHAIMVAKLKAFTQLPQQTFIDYTDKDTSFPARYARAIAYYRDLETDKAIKAIDALTQERPDDPYLWELKGQALFEVGRIKESEPAYQQAVKLKPDAPLLRVGLGQTLLALEDKARLDEAIRHLQRATDLDDDSAFAWQLLARAYDEKGDDGMARLATAEQNFSLGQMRDALTFAQRARELLPKNTPQWRRATDIVLVAETSRDPRKASRDSDNSFSFHVQATPAGASY